MKKNIFKYILFIIILLGLIFIFNNNSYATINTNYGDFPEYIRSSSSVFTKDLNYYIITNKTTADNYGVYIIPKNSEFYIYRKSNGTLAIHNLSSLSISIYHGTYNKDTGYKVTQGSVTSTDFSSNNVSLDTIELGDFNTDGLKHLIYSEVNIYNEETGYENNNIYMKAVTSPENPPIPPTEDEVPKEELTLFDIVKDIQVTLSVLTFTIIIIFLFIYLKINFSLRK